MDFRMASIENLKPVYFRICFFMAFSLYLVPGIANKQKIPYPCNKNILCLV